MIEGGGRISGCRSGDVDGGGGDGDGGDSDGGGTGADWPSAGRAVATHAATKVRVVSSRKRRPRIGVNIRVFLATSAV